MFNECILKSWWVILFFFLAFFIYDQASATRKKEAHSLLAKRDHLISKKEKAFSINQELKLQIASQNDPEYIEMVLIQNLGLIPEGQTKILLK